jgi:predicted outer membrane repeat protein
MYDSDPNIQNTIISDNHANLGGGIFCVYSNPFFQGTTIHNNTSKDGGGIYFANMSNPTFDSINRSNIYLNYAETGNDLYAGNDYDMNTLHIIVDTFSVLYPSTLFAYPLSRFTFDILNGKIESADADLFVSPTGNDDNSGLTENEPLKTIRYAVLKIYADSLHPHTIRLQEGIYSPSLTNEKFPITLIDYVSLSGISQGDVILDAEKTSRVIQLYDNKGSGISNLTITRGYGGLYCNHSSPAIQNVTFYDNRADYGGGLYLDNSDPTLINVGLFENQATKGSGIYCIASNPIVVNSTIVNNLNTNDYGGGIYCGAGSFAKIINSILWNNSPHEVILQGVYSPNSVEISYSDIMDGENGIFINGVGTVNWLEGNINEEPVFVGAGEHPYQISDLSPCIDAGTPDTIGLNLPEYDPAGNPRLVNGRVDMGAYEWNIMVGQDETFSGTISFEVYPNPANQSVTITSKNGILIENVTIYTQTGQKVYRGIPENNTLDISKLQPGMYVIEVATKVGNARKKVIVQ